MAITVFLIIYKQTGGATHPPLNTTFLSTRNVYFETFEVVKHVISVDYNIFEITGFIKCVQVTNVFMSQLL